MNRTLFADGHRDLVFPLSKPLHTVQDYVDLLAESAMVTGAVVTFILALMYAVYAIGIHFLYKLDISSGTPKKVHVLSQSHIEKHLMLLVMVLVLAVGVSLWLGWHGGVYHGWTLHLDVEKLYVEVYGLALFNVGLVRHLVGELIYSKEDYYDR